MGWPRRSPPRLLFGLALFLLILFEAASAFLRPPSSLLRHQQHGSRRSPAPSSMQRRLTSMAADSVKGWDVEADVVVIGSGIGGLAAAALCAYYGEDGAFGLMICLAADTSSHHIRTTRHHSAGL